MTQEVRAHDPHVQKLLKLEAAAQRAGFVFRYVGRAKVRPKVYEYTYEMTPTAVLASVEGVWARCDVVQILSTEDALWTLLREGETPSPIPTATVQQRTQMMRLLQLITQWRLSVRPYLRVLHASLSALGTLASRRTPRSIPGGLRLPLEAPTHGLFVRVKTSKHPRRPSTLTYTLFAAEQGRLPIELHHDPKGFFRVLPFDDLEGPEEFLPNTERKTLHAMREAYRRARESEPVRTFYQQLADFQTWCATTKLFQKTPFWRFWSVLPELGERLRDLDAAYQFAIQSVQQTVVSHMPETEAWAAVLEALQARLQHYGPAHAHLKLRDQPTHDVAQVLRDYAEMLHLPVRVEHHTGNLGSVHVEYSRDASPLVGSSPVARVIWEPVLNDPSHTTPVLTVRADLVLDNEGVPLAAARVQPERARQLHTALQDCTTLAQLLRTLPLLCEVLAPYDEKNIPTLKEMLARIHDNAHMIPVRVVTPPTDVN